MAAEDRWKFRSFKSMLCHNHFVLEIEQKPSVQGTQRIDPQGAWAGRNDKTNLP